MQKGMIKWFSHDKGYGFVKSGDSEIFLHYSAAPKKEWNELDEGKYVAFKPIQGRRSRQASQVRLISEEEAKDDRGDIPEASDKSSDQTTGRDDKVSGEDASQDISEGNGTDDQ